MRPEGPWQRLAAALADSSLQPGLFVVFNSISAKCGPMGHGSGSAAVLRQSTVVKYIFPIPVPDRYPPARPWDPTIPVGSLGVVCLQLRLPGGALVPAAALERVTGSSRKHSFNGLIGRKLQALAGGLLVGVQWSGVVTT